MEHGYNLVKTESNYNIDGYLHLGTDTRTDSEPAKPTPPLKIYSGTGWTSGGSASAGSWTNEYRKDAITVTWSDGYTDTPIKSETIDKGSDYRELYPADPAREGYDFLNWEEKTDENGNVKISAQWKEHVHNWQQISAPTCTESGLKQCACGHSETIPALGHAWGNWIDEGERHYQVCSHDATHLNVDQSEHAYGEWKTTKEPTATEAGEKVHICEKCGHVESAAIQALGGSVNQEQSNNGNVSADSGKAPQTGDNSMPMLWALLAIASGACLLITGGNRKKREG